MTLLSRTVIPNRLLPLPLVLVPALLLLAWPLGALAQDGYYGFDPDADVSERVSYRCPPVDANAAITEPLDFIPDRDNAFRVDYSSGNDLVELAGAETELAVDLGSGNDVVVYRDVTSAINLVTGPGADTVILCDMNGVRALISLSANTAMADSAVDVLIIDEGVLAHVPGDVVRYLAVQFDPASDVVVIHAAPQSWDNQGHIVVGDLVLALVPPTNWVGDFNELQSVRFLPP